MTTKVVHRSNLSLHKKLMALLRPVKSYPRGVLLQKTQVMRMSKTTIKNMQAIIKMRSHWKHVVLMARE
jgi:hypothetical protein